VSGGEGGLWGGIVDDWWGMGDGYLDDLLIAESWVKWGQKKEGLIILSILLVSLY
jgi:hypothetical protein